MLIALVGTSLWIAFKLSSHICLEDALITFRYARNMALGKGFVFNEGQRVLGTTTPLLAMILAATALVTGIEAIPQVATVFLMLASVGAGLLLFDTLKRLELPAGVSLGAAALYFLNPDMLWVSTGGMETPLVLFLMSASLHGLVSERPVMSSTSLCLLPLTRPDSLVWCGVLGAFLVAQAPRRLPSLLLPFAVIAVPWLAFSWWYFGTPVPHSVVAKSTIGANGVFFNRLRWESVRTFMEWVEPALGFPFGGADQRFGKLWVILLFILLSIPAAFKARSWRVLWVLHLFTAMFLLSMYLGRAPHFPWYLLPVTWSTTILAVVGVGELRSMMTSYFREAGIPMAVRSLLLAWVVTSVGVSVLRSGIYQWGYQAAYQRNEDGARRRIGEWLKHNSPADATVASESIGYYGFFSERRVIDLAGLISPEVVDLSRRSPDHAATFHAILTKLRPDYLVLRSYEVEENSHYLGGPLFGTDAQREYFQRHYMEAARFQAPEPIWGKLGFLTVFKRVDGRNVSSARGEAHNPRA